LANKLRLLSTISGLLLIIFSNFFEIYAEFKLESFNNVSFLFILFVSHLFIQTSVSKEELLKREGFIAMTLLENALNAMAMELSSNAIQRKYV
jgi:tellurite resistance protein TehA-like permease